jgi:Holliday junction resolvase RusA-like endonuclease
MTRRGIAFTPAKTRNQEAFIKSLFVQKYPHHVPLEGPLELTVLAFFPIPKSAKKMDRQAMEWGTIFPTKRPDVDNLLKIFMDAGNGLIYRDDSQIVGVMVDKRYSTNAHTEVKLTRPGEGE